MIDRIKIALQLSDQMPTLHKKKAESLQRLLVSWASFCSDLKFQSELAGKQFLCALPLRYPEVGFATIYQKAAFDEPYEILGVDGSQIYPDRHWGFDCFLINVGALFVSYGVHASSAQFFNEPTVFKTSILQDENIAKAVDCLRHEYEFLKALELFQSFKSSENGCILFDGSLLFWHLQPYKNLKERFLNGTSSYCCSCITSSFCMLFILVLRKAKILLVSCVRMAKLITRLSIMKTWLMLIFLVNGCLLAHELLFFKCQ
ncbi:DNA double-strand break repair nuclease NurA [bacterium]|nr:MAG: DNA double-strand break repair nuclease NurA [bacterium]